jgi:hypothetical protein
MAATVTELEILRRWDAGQSKERIRRETGISRGSIEQAIGWCSNDERRLERAAAAEANASFLAALRAA